ncbi:ComEA family DNA-binding protein [Paenibacillus popilliae]|uniref:DNA uptake protein n=1 Tax=Paenibacillus popilliae ATCC 14706 TaxID=1212764 RepID=M9LPA1_PAEPP|nr:helix-hairpin-helix domain-containing protein [Paenibacillus popilliae]GAC42316.1 DNA uptake protein [Paenibacillus popilliae ATCC 14706]
MKKSRHTLSLRAWVGLTGLAIAGLAVSMGLWLKPQWEEAAGGWTPLNEAIAERLAVEREQGSESSSKAGQSISRSAGDPNQLLTVQPDKKRAESEPGEQAGGALTSTEASAAAPSADEKAKDAASGRININEADADALMKLPGIGPRKSQAIVMYRDSYGPFQRLEDLKKVKGIGPAIFAKLRDQVSIE